MSQPTRTRNLPPCLRAALLAITVCVMMIGCGGKPKPTGPVTITVWSHTGTPEEKRVLDDQVARFNASQTHVIVKITHIPEADYNKRVAAVATNDELPDVLNIDGPYLPYYVSKGYLVDFKGLIPLDLKSDLLPSVRDQGTYKGKLYSVATFDSGLGLFGNRKKLEAIRARIPATPHEAWKADELDQILDALAYRDRDSVIIDLNMDNPGEWVTYAFSPIIQSAGGDLINRKNYRSADGVLNGPEAVAALKRVQTWFRNGWVDPDTDPDSFVKGKVELSWAGHWEYNRYKKALGDNLVLMPLPDFGHGSKTAMGSWSWGITTKCKTPRSAMRFIRFLMEQEEILAISNASSAVPGTGTAVAQSPLYGFSGPLQLYVRQLNCCAVPRPQSPAYPIITAAFQQAFNEIRHGADVQASLDKAVATIDAGIEKSGRSYQE